MWRVHEIAPSATSTQLVVHALPADAPARRGENLSNSCRQFPLETVMTAVFPPSLACVWMDLMETLGCRMQKEHKTTCR